MTELIIGLGSNLGDRRANLTEAVRRLSQFFGAPLALSTFIETEPWGYESQNRFLNGVVVFGVEMVEMVEMVELVEEVEMVEMVDMVETVETSETFETVQLFRILKIVQQVERDMGRVRTAGGYTDRIIDLDILFYGDYHYTSQHLTIPHPHIMDRDFVKIPLAEVRPDLLKIK